MPSLPKSSLDVNPHAVLAAHAGVPYLRSTFDQGFTDWLALMEVVEGLCPRWPERELSIGTDYRL